MNQAIEYVGQAQLEFFFLKLELQVTGKQILWYNSEQSTHCNISSSLQIVFPTLNFCGRRQ